ncbi:MAG: response regulator [Reichenbachiella sp.]
MELVLQRPQRKESVKKYSVLYVDDEPVNLRIFQHAFKRDYNVYTAPNGFEALDILNEKKIDLIITDQQMPKMSGVDLLAKIVPKHPNIVRMIMTGFSDIGAIIRAVNEFGLDKYLVKPWDRDQLKVEFDKALEKKESEEKSLAQSSLDDSMVKLNESILPREIDLQELNKESYIVYDQNASNHYGYWFGEVSDNLAVAFFNTTDNSPVAVGVKSFLSLSLSELIYRSKNLEPSVILKELFTKINARYKDKNEFGKLDISLVFVDKKSGKLASCGMNQNIYYSDKNDKLKMLNTGSESFELSVDTSALKTVNAIEVTDVYFISKNMINEIVPSAQPDAEGVPFLQYLRGLKSSSMSDQSKEISNMLSGDKIKNMIGIRL